MSPENDDTDGQVAATPNAGVTFAHLRSSQTVDYAFTIMQASMVAFSTMADTKANIMITVCSIVLTIGVTQFSSPLLRWPLVLLTLCTFLALFLAILAVLPSAKYPRRPDGTTGPDVPGFNPLFFGHFAHLTRDRFTAELAHVMSDDGRDLRGARPRSLGAGSRAGQAEVSLPALGLHGVSRRDVRDDVRVAVDVGVRMARPCRRVNRCSTPSGRRSASRSRRAPSAATRAAAARAARAARVDDAERRVQVRIVRGPDHVVVAEVLDDRAR